MAFKNVNGDAGQFKKLTDLEVGGSITGYFLGTRVSTQIEGAVSLLMLIDGERFAVSAAGNVKYMLQDGKLYPGQNTRITRVDDKKVKGKKSTQFTVEQDAEDTVEVPAQIGTIPTRPAATTSPSVADKIAAMKANG